MCFIEPCLKSTHCSLNVICLIRMFHPKNHVYITGKEPASGLDMWKEWKGYD